MKRITLTVVAVLLAVPAVGSAKIGGELQTDPQDLQPGQKTDVSMMVLKEPGDGQPPRAQPEPVVGVRPLATFRNAKTGEVVRVRGSRTNRDGIATAAVAFPSRGDWSVALKAPGVESMPGEQ